MRNRLHNTKWKVRNRLRKVKKEAYYERSETGIRNFLHSAFNRGGVSFLTSCSDGGDNNKKSYTISIADEDKSITLASGGSKTISVKTDGTMLAPTTSDDSIATAEISNTAKTITITANAIEGTESKTATITVVLNEDSSQKVEISVTVDPTIEEEYDTMTLTLNLAEGLAQEGDIITVKYGHSESGVDFTTTAATLSEDLTTATATLSKKYAKTNEYGSYFDNTVVTITRGDETIKTAIDGNAYFDFDSENGAALNIIAFVDESMTLSMTFDSELGATKIDVLYFVADTSYDDLDSSNSTTVSADVTDNAATITLSNAYASSWGYNAKFTLYNGSDTISAWNVASDDSTFGHETKNSQNHYYWAHVKDGTIALTFTKPAAVSASVDYVLLKVGDDDATVTFTADTEVSIDTTSAIDEAVATASLSEKTLTIKAVATGETSVTVKDTNGETATVKVYINPKEEWSSTKDYTATYIGDGTYYQILGKDMFKTDLGITSVTIEASDIEWSTTGWRYLAAHTQLAWSDGETDIKIINTDESDTTSGNITISDSAVLAKLATSGLYIAFGDTVKTSKATIKVSYSTEVVSYQTMTVMLNFDGFTIGDGGTLSVNYGADSWSGNFTPTIANDGASATFTVSSQYAGTGTFSIWAGEVKTDAGTSIDVTWNDGMTGNASVTFTANGTETLTLKQKEAASISISNNVATIETFTLDGTVQLILTATQVGELLGSLSSPSVTIELSNVNWGTSSDWQWIKALKNSDYGTENANVLGAFIDATYSENPSITTVTVTDTSTIASNGLYIAGLASVSAKITITAAASN